jgi:hypothetical protein
MSDYEYDDEAFDDGDVETAFEALEYDEARRRRRRRRRPRRVALQPAPRREADANRQRDRQLARAINETNEEISDVEARLRKVNSDLSRLRMISLISLILPRTLDLGRTRLTVVEDGSPPRPRLATTTDPNTPNSFEVVTNVTQRTDILPLILFMTMARGIGSPSASAAGMGNDMSLPLLLVLLTTQQQQQQQAGQTGIATTGGLDTTALLVLLMATGGLS